MPEHHNLQYKLAKLQMEHKKIDDNISSLIRCSAPDLLLIQRMKREKLRLKEHITQVESQILPDIIA